MLRLALLVACGARAAASPNSPEAPAVYKPPLPPIQQPPPLPLPPAASMPAADDNDSESDDDDDSIQLGMGLGFGLGFGLGLGLGIPGCIMARAVTRTRADAWQQQHTETRYNEMT